MTIKLITGIGNINKQYIDTRHNFGYKYVHLLAQKYNINLKKNNILNGYIGNLKIYDNEVILFIPHSYMNQSGLPITKCINFYKLSVTEILVAHDELDLSPGSIKIKLGKKINESHYGIKSIIKSLDNQFNFYRLRIGIGKPEHKDDIPDFVLNRPSISDKNKIDSIINKAILYTSDIINNNFIRFMNELH